MCKKTFFVLLLVIASFLSSCVDKTYDLANKEITTDVKIEGNTISLPVGSLKPIVLDSLVDVSQIEMLEIDSAGVYSITMDSIISIEKELDSITLDIEPFNYNASVNFDNVNIKNVHIKAEELEPATFGAPTISIEDLNDHLPSLESNVSPRLAVDDLLTLMQSYSGDVLSYNLTTPLQVHTSATVECNVNYELSTDIETVDSIKLGSTKDSKGTLVSVVVTNPSALRGNDECVREINFTINFPKIFVLAKNENADQASNYTLDPDKNSISYNGRVSSGEETLLSFYITDIVGISDNIENGWIKIAENIAYSIDYKLSGLINLTKEMTADDFVFNVKLDAPLSLTKISGRTKDVVVEFDPIEMKFDGEFDNLKHITKICSIDFVEAESKIKFETEMDTTWLGAFKVKEGYALKITFPESLKIAPELSTYKGEYNEAEHAFYICDFKELTDSQWELALDSLELNLPVEEQGSCRMVETVTAEFVNLNDPEEKGVFYLEGRYMDNMLEALGELGKGNKKAYFRLLESDLMIENAVVHTKGISSSLNAETTFKINEKIPAEIERINSIDFTEPVAVAMALNVAGLESLDTNIDLDVNISLPPYLKLQFCGEEVRGELNIKESYNPSSGEPLELELLCTGINFADEGIACDNYITHECDIVVSGEASIEGTEFQSKVLDNEISFNINLDIDKITVKSFHGIYNTKIDGVDEKIGLDLGEELEFLKDPKNSITLADPQLELVLKNPVGIPVDVDLHLFGTDESGTMIAESEIATKVSILPAVYDKANDELMPVETKLFITSDTLKHKKAGYNNIEIENLAYLLKTFPDSLSLTVTPKIVTEGVTHHVNIAEPIKLDAEYSVVVPLRFNDFNLCYSDTITGLKGSFDEALEMLSNVSLKAKMNVINTIPLGLSLEAIALDEDGNRIKDIEIDKLFVNAGSGKALVDENGAVDSNLASQDLNLTIKSKSGDISSLDKLALTLVAATDHVTGSAAIKGEQGIKISNIVFEVSGDIEMDFGK